MSVPPPVQSNNKNKNLTLVECSKPDPTKRKMSPCELSKDLPSLVRIKMSQGLFLPSTGLRSADQIFKALPQNPHLEPLSKYCSTVLHGIRLGLDAVFLNLTHNLSSLVDSQQFICNLEDYVAQLQDLGDLGYEVSKFWERFDELRRIAEQEKAKRQEDEEVEMNVKDRIVKVDVGKSKVLELEEELKILKAALKEQESEIEGLKSNSIKLKGDVKTLSDEFKCCLELKG